ncbi:MAG: hypothetical protein E6Z81_05135 [Schaalia odontolytica]|nr:hypothetical protein [Schaalia odontolytica]MDU5761752.1 hypothetical protein [Schaalia odontolytica]
MEPHTDEPLNNGTRARNRKGSLSRKGVRRSGVGAAALSIVMLLSGCLSLASLDEKPIDKLTTGEAVIALRLGGAEASAALPGGTGDNWIVLLDSQGRGQAGHVERGERGDIAWTELGVSYGVQAEDFLTTQEGTQRIPRVGDRSVEYFRFALPDGRIEVISAARGSGIRADIIERDGTMTSVETDDKSGGFGLCGSRVLAIMNTEVSQSMKSAAFEVYAAQSGGEGSEPEDFSVVVQLDDPAGATPRILAAAPMIPGLRSVQHLYACEGNLLTAPSIQVDDPIGARGSSVVAARGTLVLQRWDLSTGQRSVSPVLDEAGNAIHLNEDLDIYGDKAILVGNEYRLISRHGHAFSINLTSGQGRHLFSIPEQVGQGDMVFQVTESGVYFLTDSSREHAVTLSYHPWDGDDSRVVLSTGSLEGYLRVRKLFSGGQRAIESFALRPGWDGGAQ